MFLVPKGRRDCGNHEWYRSELSTWRCYHCEVGVTHEMPWNEREFMARELEARAALLRADSESAQPFVGPTRARGARENQQAMATILLEVAIKEMGARGAPPTIAELYQAAYQAVYKDLGHGRDAAELARELDDLSEASRTLAEELRAN
ncbi:MAG: hypothetical protein ACLP01_29610 [Solirubrobacteraceae bacterium]